MNKSPPLILRVSEPDIYIDRSITDPPKDMHRLILKLAGRDPSKNYLIGIIDDQVKIVSAEQISGEKPRKRGRLREESSSG